MIPNNIEQSIRKNWFSKFIYGVRAVVLVMVGFSEKATRVDFDSSFFAAGKIPKIVEETNGEGVSLATHALFLNLSNEK